MRLGLREIVFFCLLLGVLVASFYVVFEPRERDTERIEQSNRKKQVKLDTLRQATQLNDDLGSEIDRLREAIAIFERKLPAQREVEVILREVAQLAKKHKLLVDSLRTDKVIAEAGYSKLPIRLEIAGDFDRFYSFLLDLERLERITALPMMKLKRVKQKNEDPEGEMRAELRLDIFFEDPRNQAGPSALRVAPTRSAPGFDTPLAEARS